MIPAQLNEFIGQREFNRLRVFFDQVITDSLLFWTREEITDFENGGLYFWFDVDGQKMDVPKEQNAKSIINLLRVMYMHALYLSKTPGDARVETQLERGCKFLDAFRLENGSYLNWIEMDGSHIKEQGTRWFTPEADSISTIYLLYIASEIYQLLGDERYLTLALNAFDVLEQCAWDVEFGGYFNTMNDESRTDFSKNCGQNMHMALALSKLVKCSEKKIFRDRMSFLVEHLLLSINEYGLGYNSLSRDWKDPVFDDSQPGSPRILAGHNLELVWYLEDVCDVLKCDYPPALLISAEAMKNLVDERGYFNTWVEENGKHEPAKGMIWWSQFEAMIMLMRVYKRTGDETYLSAFERVCLFTFEHLYHPTAKIFNGGIDFSTGKLAPLGGWAWKGGLHTVRGLMECNKVISNLHN